MIPSRPADNPGSSERFQIGDLLGQGGMARVFRAHDVPLQREVALKFLKSDDPDRLSRFLREAQAQARVDHENVCKIFEVGELDGRPYIAMQLIEGQPLFVPVRRDEPGAENDLSHPGPLLGQMTVEQKARMMQRVAEGIHAAHREGLIHRDIKPSNIMLEATEQGDFKPTVLDFGLAREVASAGATSLGLAAGTPHFMAPEQARGETSALDRRTDVYGLGATLYAILAGTPPFDGPSSLDVLIKVTEVEAPPLTAVPEDLSTIVAKCLQKEPALRYDSARALAEDLGRYLDGEPIQARRASLAYRLGKKARKHRKLVAAGSIASAAFIVLAAWSAHAQIRAQQRARLAGVFGQEVKGIETRMQIAHLLPEHDITPEKTAVREDMAALEARMRDLGSVADGPGHYALGRGYLALGEPDKAREHLSRAWETGYREREVSYALGLSLGALYQRELERAGRVADAKQREAQTKKAQAELRDPALRALAESRGLRVSSSEYVEALVAFYERRYDQAIEKARAACARSPWLYEARALEAAVEASVAKDHVDNGRFGPAAEAIARAEAAYAAAFVIGRSDGSIPAGLCRLEVSAIKMRNFGHGGDLTPYFRSALEACDRAIRIDPDLADAQTAKAQVLWRQATEGGREARALLDAAAAACRQALRIRPEDAETHYALSQIRKDMAEGAAAVGRDPRADFQDAMREIEETIARAPLMYKAYSERGIIYRGIGSYESRRGGDPTPAWRQAEESARRALALKPDYDLGFANLSLLYLLEGRYEVDHGQDPRPTAVKALSAARDAVAASPRSIKHHALVARAHALQAEGEVALGLDPQEGLTKATEAFQKVFAVDPTFRDVLDGMARVELLAALHAFDRGQDPRPRIEAGLRWTRRARERAPDDPPHALEAGLGLLEARWRIRQGLPPEQALAAAQATAEAALRVDASDSDANADMAEIAWLRGRSGPPAARDIARGRESAEKALAFNPAHARALAVRGALLLEAVHLGGVAERQVLRAQARDSLERAIAVNAFLSHEYDPLLDTARQSPARR
jgi:serine/threonine-protein kinase